jgi:hypothetical protein
MQGVGPSDLHSDIEPGRMAFTVWRDSTLFDKIAQYVLWYAAYATVFGAKLIAF